MVYERIKKIPESQRERLNAIGKKILNLRNSTGLSIERFCAKNDIPRISYSNLETGKNFHMTTLLKVLDVYKDIKSLNDFFKDL
jgi:transcriptional regulator with XRE-family HTH domain